ncbi:NAD(P)H-dependent flavin oxidoreductase [Chloroflexota bacterium]
MKWSTKIIELLGCKYPILEGAYAKQGGWKFAAAVAEAGGHGLITATVARTPEKLREYIRRCRDATDGTFGVNLSIGICPQVEAMLEVCLEEQVPVETAVYKPDLLAPRIKESGVRWIHKTARIKEALHAEKLGVDAVIIVGLEGTGFKQAGQLPTMLTILQAKRELKIPFIAAGGIGDARGFLGAMAMGADGIMMGTAFMATTEFPLPVRAKEAIVRASPYDPGIYHRVLGSVDPQAYEEVMRLQNQYSVEEWLPMLARVHYKDPDWKNTKYRRTSAQEIEQLIIVSLAAGVIDRISPVREFIDSMVRGAEELFNGREFLKQG